MQLCKHSPPSVHRAYWSVKVKMKSRSRVRLFVTPWTIATRLFCPWDFPGKSTGVGIFPSPGDLPNPGVEPGSPALQAVSLPSEPPGKSHYINGIHSNWGVVWFVTDSSLCPTPFSSGVEMMPFPFLCEWVHREKLQRDCFCDPLGLSSGGRFHYLYRCSSWDSTLNLELGGVRSIDPLHSQNSAYDFKVRLLYPKFLSTRDSEVSTNADGVVLWYLLLKKYASKWTHEVQSPVVQGSMV